MHFGKTACECIACGKTFERPASYIARNLDRRCYCSKKCRKKEHNPNWNPDRLSLKTTENKRIRSSTLMEQWRKSVFERDNYTCVLCGKHGGILNGHHIKRIVDAPNLVYNVNNGVTLCECPCHKQVNGAESQYEPQFLSYINLRRLPIVDCYSQA
jgi:5-methylcytosine-specific restriction endonuclease McrA